MRREYDGVTGQELLELLLLELRKQLEKDGRLAYSQAYHNVEVSGYFEVTSYPHEPPVEVFTVQATVGSEPPKGAKVQKSIARIGIASHKVPDLVREEIKGAREREAEGLVRQAVREATADVDILTRPEGKASGL